MFAKQFRRKISSVVSKEVTIPVPWGIIAGKQWTNSEMIDHQVKPWIVLHGWLDNAGSFDTLAPMLVSSCPQHSLLCIDYPGHGLSSHIAPGHMYHYLESMRLVRTVACHMGLDTFGIMGHSMGAGLSSLFAATHPDMVKALVMIEVTALRPVRQLDEFVVKTRETLDIFNKLEKKLAKGSATGFKSLEEAVTRLQNASKNDNIHMKRGQSSKDGEDPLTKESLGILLKRGLQNIDESYFSFSRDLRHKCPSLNSFSPEQAEQFARNIKCPHLVIKANNGVYEDKESVAQALNCYQKNPKFEMVNVKGTHHVHLNNPERLIPHLEKFIGKHF